MHAAGNFTNYILSPQARYAKNLGLAGVLIWQIDTDDFQPFCYEEPFHLVNEVKRALELPAGDENEVVRV